MSYRSTPVAGLIGFYACCLISCPPAFAETTGGNADSKVEYPFQLIQHNGKMFKFDKRSGNLEPLDSGSSESAPDTVANKQKDKNETVELRSPTPPKNNPPKFLVVDGETIDDPADGYAPRTITDTHRRRAAADIADYKKDLGIIQTIHVSGDSVTGLLGVTNRGNKKLLAVEVTLSMPTTNEKIEKRQFVLGYQPGQEAPPQPAIGKDKRPDPVIFKVDFPAPPDVKGKFNTEITYLLFAKD